MSFTTWLKSIGQKIASGTQAFGALVPIIGGIITTADPDATSGVNTFENIVGTVISVEGAVAGIAGSNITGAQKAQAAAGLVAQFVLAAPFMKGKTVDNQANFTKACQTIAGGVADLLNSLKA